MSIAENQMQLLYQNRDAVVKNSDTATEEVNEFFRELRKSLDHREKAVLNTIRRYTDVKLSTLDLHHQKLQEDRVAIAGVVESLQKLLHANEGQLACSLLPAGSALEEELELHQNSVLSICDSLEEAKLAARFLAFSGNLVTLGESLREAGALNECQRIPDTNILSMQRVVVSETEDPYLLVPSRFEDLQTAGPREEVRIDGRKKSQRVMRMSDMVEDDNIQYQLPRDFIGSPSPGDAAPRSLAEGLFQSPSSSRKLKKVRQQPSVNGRVSPTTIDCQPPGKRSPESTPRRPPLPPHRAGEKSPPAPPPRKTRKDHKRLTPPPLPPKSNEEENIPAEDGPSDLYDVPRLAMQENGTPQDTYDVPRHLLQDHTTGGNDTYDVPRHLLQDHSTGGTDTYDVPRHLLQDHSTGGTDTYDVPRHLLQDHSTGGTDTYDVPRHLLQDHTTGGTDTYDVPQVVAEDFYDVPRNLLISPVLSPSHSGYQQLHKLQLHPTGGEEDTDIYCVPKPTSPTEPLPPPRPPKPGSTSSASSTPMMSSSPSTPVLSPSPHADDFPLGVIPPRGPSPRPKPRTSSMTGFDYINTSIPPKALLTQKQQQSLALSSSTDIRSRPIPAPRVRRSQTFKETPTTPQSAPATTEKVKDKFKWNREPRLTEAERRLSTLPPDIKLGENRSRHCRPLTIFTADQLARPVNDDQVYPCGVCCSPVTGLLVVTDVFNHCLRLLDPTSGDIIERIGREGRSGGNFKEPSAVVMDSNEHIFVTELDNPRVQKFTSRGKYLLKFGQKAFWGSQLHDPYGLALSPNDDRLYITDWEKGRILVYHKDGRHAGTIGKDHAFLKFPAGLVFDKQGNLLVTDRGKHCVWVMSRDGKPISRIGKLGTGDGELLLPHGIAVLNDNSIAVSESGNHRVSIFAPNGQFIRSFGEKGDQPGMFHYPRHMCVDNKGHLVVADEHNQRIQIFDV